ncbi:hypothetical protein DFH11DRAFT_1603010 [Phellopilus nigrolimitatus]|nr:hypothetical protein DFH11DRAFT_1603010 [Phellopilus nigrolimitatus]
MRKEERPLLAHDYEQQQIDDHAVFEMAQKERLESAKLSYQQDLDTKRRFAHVMDDCKAYRAAFSNERNEELAKKRDETKRKFEEEKLKRREAVLKVREEQGRKLEQQRWELEEQRLLGEERLAEEQYLTERKVYAKAALQLNIKAERRRLRAEAALRAYLRRREEQIETRRAARRLNRFTLADTVNPESLRRLHL